MGQSGAGKSTLLNAIYNNSVSVANLQSPAPTSAIANGVTSEMQNYIADRSLLLTDTVGCDDVRFDPSELASELRHILRASQVKYTHVVLCLPKGRVTLGTRVYLKMLQTLFGQSYINNLILYISHCEDGTSPELFVKMNSDDEDIGPLLKQVQRQKELDGVDRIITGSLMCHHDPSRDKLLYLQERKKTLDQIKHLQLKNFGCLHPPPRTFIQLVGDLFRRIFDDIFIMKKNLDSVLNQMAQCCSKISIHNHYPECAICVSDEYKWDEDNMPVAILCGHIFHAYCVKSVTKRICPCCRAAFTLPGTKMPLGINVETG